jgi:methionyl-tRNA formyltransferase
MKYLVVTIKDWNIEEYKKYSNRFQGEWHLITNEQELTLENLKKINPEYIFFPHWSWMVPEEITNNYKCVCFHMTDLPYGRGGSPLQNLIIRGHKETKLTALKMTSILDAGDIYKKVDLDLSGSAQEIFIRMSKKIAKLINYIITENPRPEQQEGRATFFDRRSPAQSEIPKNASQSEVYDHIRMLDADSYPKAYIDYGNYRLLFSNIKIHNGELISDVKLGIRR